jgi:lipoyl-dependent peroxiredoxin
VPTRRSSAVWSGSIARGSGTMTLGSGAWEGAYDVPSRFEDGAGTIAAAHAGCFSMALSGALTRAGHEVEAIDTTADVTVEKVGEGFEITGIVLTTVGRVAGIDEATFVEFAEGAKAGCPVSKALSATSITLEASLAG